MNSCTPLISTLTLPFYQILNSDLFPNILQTAIIVAITALIAAAIFLIDPVKKERQLDIAIDIDIKVILTHVLHAAKLGVSLIALFLILMFLWPASDNCAYKTLILLIFIGVYYFSVAKALYNCYKWIEDSATETCGKIDKESYNKSFRNKCRNKFFEKNKTDTVWLLMWDRKISAPWAEEAYINQFISYLNKAIKKRSQIVKRLSKFNQAIIKWFFQ